MWLMDQKAMPDTAKSQRRRQQRPVMRTKELGGASVSTAQYLPSTDDLHGHFARPIPFESLLVPTNRRSEDLLVSPILPGPGTNGLGTRIRLSSRHDGVG